MKRTLFILLFLIPFILQAQTNDESTVLSKSMRYPATKPFSLQFDQVAASDYTNKRGNKDFGKGRAELSRFKAFGSFLLYQKDRLTLSENVWYSHMSLTTSNAVGPSGFVPAKHLHINDVDLITNAFYQSTLWGKPVVHQLSLIMASSNLINVKKVLVTASSSLVFVKSPQTRYTLGLLLISDPASVTPIIPIATYWHQFANPLWEIDAVMPQKIMFRKADFLKGWLSIGTELVANSFFTSETPQLQANYEFVSADLYSGLGYERLFGKILIGVRTGYRNGLQNRLIKVYDRNRNYFLETKIKGAAYFNLNFSFVLPNQSPKTR